MKSLIGCLVVWVLVVMAAGPASAFCEVAPTSQTYAVGTVLGGAVCGTTGGQGVELRTTLAGEDQTNSVMRVEGQWEYETIAASQADQVMGTTGAAGDVLHAVVCVMTAASVGAVTIKDGTGSAINLIAAQAAAIQIFTPPLDLVSSDGGWKITTGTNTTCIGVGRFS